MGHKFDPRHVARLDDPARLDSQHPDAVLGLLELTGDETVVDYGAGAGSTHLPLAAALPRGRVVAVDMSPELLDILESELAARAGGPGADRGNTADNVPLPDGAADAIVAVNVWHEIYDETEALDEMRRLPPRRRAARDRRLGARRAPRGPAGRHVLTLEQALACGRRHGSGRVWRVRAPGPPLPYHYAIASPAPWQPPRDDDAGRRPRLV